MPVDPAAGQDSASALQWPGTPVSQAQPAQATQWPGTPLGQPSQPAEPSLLQTVGAGIGEAFRHPIDFIGEASGVLNPSNVEAGLGAIGAAIQPNLLGPQGEALRNQAATEVVGELPSAVQPVVAGLSQTLLPKAALLSRAIDSQNQGQGLEGLNAAIQQGFQAQNPGAVSKIASVGTNILSELPFLANPAIAPVAMAAQGAESAITENQAHPDQSVGQDLLNVGGQAALNYLFGKLLPGQKVNSAILKKFAPELIKASEGAIRRTLLQAGIQGAEGYAFSLANNSIRKLAGQDVSLTEGANANAGIQAITGGLIHGLNEYGRPAPAPVTPTDVKVPDLLQKMVVKSREGENKGQPIDFATPVEKAQHIVNRPDFRGPVVDAAKQYLTEVGKAQVEQNPTGNLAPNAPTPEMLDIEKLRGFYSDERIAAMTSEEKVQALDAINPQPVTTKAETPAPAPVPDTTKLSKELAGAKPRYGLGDKLYELNFENDLDKAMYIVAKNSKSKRHADYLTFIEQQTGLKRAEIPAEAAKVRDAIKAQAKSAPEGTEALDVPAISKRTSPKVKPDITDVTTDEAHAGATFNLPPLNKQQAMARDAMARKGVSVVFMDHPNYEGFVDPRHPGTLFIDRAAGERGFRRALLHELGHEVQINHPEEFSQLHEAMSDPTIQDALSVANSRAGAKESTPFTKRESEVIPFEEIANDPRIVRLIEGKKPGLISKIVEYVKDFVRRFTGTKNPLIDKTVELLNKMEEAPLRNAEMERNVTDAFGPVTKESDAPGTTYGYWFDKSRGGFRPVDYQKHDDAAAGMGFRGTTSALERGAIRIVADPKQQHTSIEVGLGHSDKLEGLRSFVRDQLLDGRTVEIEANGDHYTLDPFQKGSMQDFNKAIAENVAGVAAKPKEKKLPEEDRGPRPDLSLRVESPEGRKAYVAEDVAREKAGKPGTKADTATFAEADKLVARGDPALHELIAKGNSGQQFTDVETVAVRKFTDQHLSKALTDGDIARVGLIGNLIAADRNAGSEQGRAFRQRNDPVSPAQRLQQTLAEAIAVPPTEEGKTSSKTAKIDHLKAIKKYLREKGLIDQMTPANLADPVWVSQRLNELSALNPKANKIYEYFLASVLSGPQTQERNFLGNLTNMTMNQGLLRPIEIAINSVVKDPKAAQLGEWKYLFKDLAPRFQQAWVNAVQSFRAERPIFNGRIVEGHADLTGPAIAGRKGQIIRSPLRLLTAVDQFMKTVVGTGEVGARAFREGKAKGFKDGSPEMSAHIKEQMDNPDSQAWQDALGYAKSVAFQDAAGPITKSFIHLRESVVLPGTDIHPLRYMVLGPFLRIAGKLESELWKYTPFGSLPLAAKGLAGKYKGNAPAAIQDVAKQMIAWSTFAALWSATGGDKDEPWITGSVPKDAKDMAYRTAPPMSIRLPGYGWVSYKHLQPISGAITTMIDSIEGIKGVERGQSFNDALSGFVQKVKGRVQDQTFLQSLGDFLDALDSTDKATAFLTNFGASWVPNLVRQPLYQAQGTVKEGKQLADTGPFDQLSRRALPGVFAALPRVTPWGEEVTRPGTALERMLVPFTRYSDKVHPADAVIAKFNLQNPDTPFNVAVPSPVMLVDGKYKRMTEREYYVYLRLSGLLADRAVRQIQGVRNGVADSRTMDQIKQARERALDQAGNQMRADLHYKSKGQTDRYAAILSRAESAIERLEK